VAGAAGELLLGLDAMRVASEDDVALSCCLQLVELESNLLHHRHDQQSACNGYKDAELEHVTSTYRWPGVQEAGRRHASCFATILPTLERASLAVL
jgi:hypothetical protein